MKKISADSLWVVDAIKALASQLIVWHHLMAYGPLPGMLHPEVAEVLNLLFTDARLAVQSFLVVGGFLAARSLLRWHGASAGPRDHRNPMVLLWPRYLRLLAPYAVALLLAVVCAYGARQLLADPDTPAAPGAWQMLAHLLLLHDLFGVPALSAGVWYIAIDFQLFALACLLLWMATRLSHQTGFGISEWLMVLSAGVAVASLCVWNRNTALDPWAIYFFGAYGLGILAHGVTEPCRWRYLRILALLGIVTLALLVESRSRVVVAGLTVVPLIFWHDSPCPLRQSVRQLITWMGAISYAVFLVHYPIALLVGAIFSSTFPSGHWTGLTGLFVAWGTSLLVAYALHREIEQRSATWVKKSGV